MDFIDKAGDIREGEELDVGRIDAFLKDSIPGLQGETTIRQFPGGYSNLTYLVRAGGREMVLRRPPFGRKAKTAHDMHREYTVLKALRPAFPCCPEPLAYTDDPAVMGCPFYVMERIKGIILRKNPPKGMSLTPVQARSLCENLIRVMHELHSVDYKAIGLGDFGKPDGYVRRQVKGWIRRYRDARTPDAPDCEQVMQWLHDKMPADAERPGIIHNDYRFDNAVLNPANPLEIIGILDWEMAALGDPLMDLGATLAYWVDRDDLEDVQFMRMMPTTLDGMLTRKEVADLYMQLSGRRVENFDFYYCFGLFRLAVIVQQIYYRYFHGQTKDDRFALLIGGVIILNDAALRVIKKSEI